jgi:hypothetical protein
MTTVLVKIHFANGDFQEFTKGPEFLSELSSLQAQGFSGKELIQCLLTDDWAAPPLMVDISGPGLDTPLSIPYT